MMDLFFFCLLERSSSVLLFLSVLVHQRRILFWLKMVRSDDVILRTLAGCSRDSVLALLEKTYPN